MGTFKGLVIALIFLEAVFPVCASACSVPTPSFDPNDFKSGVILEGVIQSSQRDGRMISVTLDVERVVQGQYYRNDYTFSFFPSEGGGACLPASTQVVPNGQRLVIYLEWRDAGLWRKGWMHFENAVKQDYRVRVLSTQDQ